MTGWIFGLSVDNKIEWKLAPVPAGTSPDFELGVRGPTYGSLKEHPGDLNRSGKLQSKLREALSKFLDKQNPLVRKSVRAIGVSAVGTIDRYQNRVITVGMSDWLPHQQPILDCRELFIGLFGDEIFNSRPGVPPLINIRNDTTAKCLAEWHRFPWEYRNRDAGFSILYVLFSEGVNASFVSAGRLVTMPLNTEMGHMFPRPHVADFEFDESQSGCGRHTYCFEGLASLTRIRKSWGANIPFVQLGPEAHDRIAYYAAQMCLNGIAMLAPSRILLGGSTFFEGMVPLIRAKMDLMNKGQHQEPYVAYADLDDEGFIQIASIPVKQAGIAAALGLAHETVLDPGRALSPTGSPWKPVSVWPSRRG